MNEKNNENIFTKDIYNYDYDYRYSERLFSRRVKESKKINEKKTKEIRFYQGIKNLDKEMLSL